MMICATGEENFGPSTNSLTKCFEHIKSGKLQQAGGGITAAMTKKTDSETFYDLADQLMKEKRYDEAIELYKKLTEIRPGDDSIILSLAWACRDGGRTAEAMECFETLFEKELARTVFTGFAFDEMVRICREDGNYEKVVELCERAVSAQPDDPALLNTLGEACIKAGRAQQAVEVFELLARREPDSPMVFCYLGNARVAAGQYEKADEAYGKAIAIEPSEAHTFYSRQGNAYEQAGQYRRAQKAARKALECCPDYPLYYSILGDIMIKEGKIDEARENYERAIMLDAGSGGAYYNRMAHSLEQAGYPAEAVATYEKAIAADPTNLYYYKALIDICASHGMDDKVREYYEKAKTRNLIG
jgi:tetratricopeptide (TPR) repeat protein